MFNVTTTPGNSGIGRGSGTNNSGPGGGGRGFGPGGGAGGGRGNVTHGSSSGGNNPGGLGGSSGGGGILTASGTPYNPFIVELEAWRKKTHKPDHYRKLKRDEDWPK